MEKDFESVLATLIIAKYWFSKSKILFLSKKS